MKRILITAMKWLGFSLFGIPFTLYALEPIKIKAVVVVTYEAGNYRGDKPGGLQPWVEGENMNEILSLPTSFRDDVILSKEGVLGIVSGRGSINGALSILSLGLDPRFDLTKAYWFLTALTGIDPEDATLASVVWSEWVVDGDWAHEIDIREAPEGWSTGYFPVHSDSPDRIPPHRGETDLLKVKEAYHLNPKLVEWAFQLTRNITIEDTPEMANYRAQYKGYPNALRPPFVLKGANIAAGTYWHGKRMNDWANKWVGLWTNGKGNMVTTSTPDGGRMGALTALARAGKVNLDRVLQMHVGMNFSMQAPGMTALQSIKGDSISAPHPGMLPALNASYKAGHIVLREIIEHWNEYENKTPGD